MDLRKKTENSNGVIVATPTDSHIGWLDKLVRLGIPVLCEKPICKDLGKLEETLALYDSENVPLNMVNQYWELPMVSGVGHTEYNYWNHGKDGMAWDCIQLVGLAKSTLTLRDDSPMWRCHINGSQIDLREMDVAYIRMIQNWMKHPGQVLADIMSLHEKTAILAEKLQNGEHH